ncbi:hypothetical protein SAMN05880574_10231 [Chryseobacterium sp. RU37D]|nr:hypothetical protein SAMN05880574_10231 [Chryseobacterium sp. RU37D]
MKYMLMKNLNAILKISTKSKAVLYTAFFI